MRKNIASQIIGAQMITVADGSDFTGSVTCYYTLDGGTQTIGSVGSGVCTHEGNGYHTYAPAQGETNGDIVAYTFIGTGALTSTIQIFTIQHDPAVVAEITAVRMTTLTDWINGGRLDLILDARSPANEYDTEMARLDVAVSSRGTADPGDSMVVSDKTGFALSATGADLILKSSTFVQAIVAAVNEFATYGLTALNTLLTSTGIKTSTTAAPADMALDSTVAKDSTVSKPGTAQTITAPADMALNSTVAKEATLDLMSGATFDTATDSLEAIRNRGDAEWVTGAGGSSPTVEEIRAEIDSNSTQLAAILDDTDSALPALIATAQSDLDKLTGADGATLATLQGNYAPNIVVPDAAGTAPTAAEIKTALEAAGGILALTKTEVDATKAVTDKLDDMIEVVP